VDLDVLEQDLDRLTESDQGTSGEIDSIERMERLERLHARVEAHLAQQVADFDASGVWAPSGARTAGAFLAHHCRLPNAEARRQVRRGRNLRHLPRFAEAWSKGQITAQHVDVIASVRRPATEAALERDESMLVEQAKTLQFAEFVRAVRYWEQHADPDGAEEDAMEMAARRDVFLTSSFNGMWLGTMTLDPISGSIVSSELERLERELFMADWAKAKDELGRDPHLDELCRTSSQRRADALVEMATRSKSMPADGRRPEPLFSVLVGYEELRGRICELANGAVVAPGSLLPWLEEADMERAVFAPGGRVEVSITSRFFTGATRRAIELRDRICQHPYCDQPVERCQVDHIVEFSKGGLTTQENGRLLCAFHNRLRNQRPPPRE
jgi:hypothetical protein